MQFGERKKTGVKKIGKENIKLSLFDENTITFAWGITQANHLEKYCKQQEVTNSG